MCLKLNMPLLQGGAVGNGVGTTARNQLLALIPENKAAWGGHKVLPRDKIQSR